MIEEEIALAKKWATAEVEVSAAGVADPEIARRFERAFVFHDGYFLLLAEPGYNPAVGQERSRWFANRPGQRRLDQYRSVKSALWETLGGTRNQHFVDPKGRLRPMVLLAKRAYDMQFDAMFVHVYARYEKRWKPIPSGCGGNLQQEVDIVCGYIAGGAWGAMLDFLGERYEGARKITKMLIKREPIEEEAT